MHVWSKGGVLCVQSDDPGLGSLLLFLGTHCRLGLGICIELQDGRAFASSSVCHTSTHTQGPEPQSSLSSSGTQLGCPCTRPSLPEFSSPAPTPYCTPTSGSRNELSPSCLSAFAHAVPSARNALPCTFLSTWQTSYPLCHLFSVAFVTLYSLIPQVGSLPSL